MNVQTISVNICHSAAMADGAWKTVERGAEGALTPDEDYHQAQHALYHELGQTMKYVFSGNGSGYLISGRLPVSQAVESGSSSLALWGTEKVDQCFYHGGP